MSKRSEKEARNNDDLVSQFFPVLAVTALLSYFQYRKLKKQYLANPQAKRIDDLMAHTPILVVATFGIMLVLGGVYSLAMWTFKGHAGYAPVVALAAYAGWLAIKRLLNAQSACLLGVVVDYQAGTLTFPTLHPALTTVELAQVAQMTREDGNKLHIAGEFGSNTLTFSNKRLRDECIYLLKSDTAAKMPAEME